jgi:uncharacterized protein (DUF488 family)
MTHPFFTIGHSSRSIDEFVDLLGAAKVQLVVDVRTMPRSRTNPQFNRDMLPLTLSEFAIGYEHISALGGLRPRKLEMPPSQNSFWKNSSFHNYADYAMGEEFRSGMRRLCKLGHGTQSAIMCSEAVWWRCHRRIIADYLISGGEVVYHILGPNRIEPAYITPAATMTAAGTITYPARPRKHYSEQDA